MIFSGLGFYIAYPATRVGTAAGRRRPPAAQGHEVFKNALDAILKAGGVKPE
jgi:hypothetical protein